MLVYCSDVGSLVSVIVLMGVHMLVYCCDVGSLVSVIVLMGVHMMHAR